MVVIFWGVDFFMGCVDSSLEKVPRGVLREGKEIDTPAKGADTCQSAPPGINEKEGKARVKVTAVTCYLMMPKHA